MSAANATSSVTGSASPIRLATDVREASETPRLPVERLAEPREELLDRGLADAVVAFEGRVAARDSGAPR